jgi:single-stranded DNA-binding protein
MDLNLAVLSSRVAAEPELRVFELGARVVRLLVTVRRKAPRRRVDVLPVTVWDPEPEIEQLQSGERVWLVGAVERRFWEASEGRRSRLEIVAEKVETEATVDREAEVGA